MKKRRLPSLRRQGREPDSAGVGFEDLPPDERSSEVVMHPSGDAAQAGADPDDTKPRPTMPASAVTVHETPEPGAASGQMAVDDDYAFRPPSDADPDVPADADDSGGGEADDLDPFVPDVVVDADVRDEILESLSVSTFVEGPPGSGISTMLTRRVVASLRAGNVAADSVAVVTRDAGAGAAFRDRLRDALEEAATEEDDDVARRRLGAAVTHLRSTPIGPGAVVAEGILRRWPEAARVAPAFTVVPAPEARLDFEAAFGAWLAGPGGAEPAVTRALARGVTPAQIHGIAEAMTRHIGLLAPDGTPPPPAEPDIGALREESARRIGELVEIAEHGADSDDGVVQVRALARWLGDAAGLDETFAGHFLANAPTKVRAAGSRANWDPPEMCATQMERSRELHVAWTRARRGLGRSTLDALVGVLSGFVGAERARRMRAGRLFDTDVIPTALELLAADAAVRRIEHDRHGLVVIDDVWDVDAATLALVLTLTSLSDDVGDPFALRPGPGRLVVGGAATTALLRSRGADPRLVTRLHDRATSPLRLRTSFRQAPALLGWTAAACRTLFADDADVQVEALPVSPAPLPVREGDAAPDPAPDPETGAVPATDAGEEREADVGEPAGQDTGSDPHSAVATNEIPLPSQRTVLTPEGHVMSVPIADDGNVAEEAEPAEAAVPEEASGEPLPAPDPAAWGPVVAAWVDAGGGADALRAAEARAVAGALRMLVDSATACVCGPDGAMRPPTWSDCAVVLGSGAGVETYLDALDAEGVPYTRRSTGAELLLRQEVQDLLAILRAADDPTDVIATLAALRGLGFGCSDTELVAAVACNGGPLRPTATPPEGTPTAVAEALQVLARLGEDRDLPALALVDLALDLTGLRDGAAAARGADPGCIDAVRGIAAASCGANATVATFLAYVDAGLRPMAPSGVTQPPPMGSDAVEVLTAAEAQGRELPVVAVANMHRQRVPMPAGIADFSARQLHVRAGRPDRGLVTEGFDAALARDDEEYLAQRTRLVCSAFSRARDVLIVALAATAVDVGTDADVPRRELVRRVARLLVEPDADAPGGLRARPGVTLVAVPAPATPPPAAAAAGAAPAAAAPAAGPRPRRRRPPPLRHRRRTAPSPLWARHPTTPSAQRSRWRSHVRTSTRPRWRSPP